MAANVPKAGNRWQSTKWAHFLLTVVPIMGIYLRMRLADYMRSKDLDDEAMAAALGSDVSAWAVRKWRYGQRVPRREMQKRILDATEGAVTPNDLFEAAEAADAPSDSAPAKSPPPKPSSHDPGTSALASAR